jgi:hypothetical protein
MTQIDVLPRPAGATVLSLLAVAVASLALATVAFAAPGPEGSDPVLTISPSPAVLPATTVGNQSPSVEFELRNDSAEEATVEKVMLEGEDSGEFSPEGSNCGTLQPGDHCSAWISFKPNGVGVKKTALHVTFAAGRPEQSFEVSGTSALPHFSFQPGSHDFGLQPIRTEARQATFQIENDGAAAAQVGQLNFTGDSNGFWFGNSDCWGRWMAPGETCSLEVYFGPNDVGSYATQLQLSSGSENFTADVTGEGGRPIVEAAPNPADFGAATVGSTSAIQTIVISNSGNVPTSFFIGIIAGGDAGSFQLLDESCTGIELMPSSSCVAHIRFRPQAAGAKAAHLAFFGNTEGGAMVGLQGEGIAPAVTLVPSAFDFGTQAAGSKSAGHAFAVGNEGAAPLELGGVSIVGADLDQFALAGDECTGETLAPGAECLLRVRFAPDSEGVKAAKLRVGSTGGAFAAALTGLGSGFSPDEGAPLQASQAQGESAPATPRKRVRPKFRRGKTVSAGASRVRRHARGAAARG